MSDAFVMQMLYGFAVVRPEMTTTITDCTFTNSETLDQPGSDYKRLRANCENCGAPGESVCSYCGTRS